MPLLKSHRARDITRSAIVLDLGDLNRQAERIIADARAEAAGIVADGRAEAQKLIDAADAKGFGQGLERGTTEGREQGRAEGNEAALRESGERFATLAESWERTLERWESEYGSMLQSARDDVLAFAFAMGRKILLRELELDPTLVEAQVAETLTYLSQPSSITVVVHPDDEPFIAKLLPELVERIDGCTHAAIETDDQVGRGGCVIRTARGGIDATIEKQIERIAQTLLPDGSDTLASPSPDSEDEDR